MTTVWALLDDAFYHSLKVDGWARADNCVDGHGLVAMARRPRLSVRPTPDTDSENVGELRPA